LWVAVVVTRLLAGRDGWRNVMGRRIAAAGSSSSSSSRVDKGFSFVSAPIWVQAENRASDCKPPCTEGWSGDRSPPAVVIPSSSTATTAAISSSPSPAVLGVFARRSSSTRSASRSHCSTSFSLARSRFGRRFVGRFLVGVVGEGCCRTGSAFFLVVADLVLF
jgi:hypothetical protein